MVRELEQIGTDEKHTCASLLLHVMRQPDAINVAGKSVASIERSSIECFVYKQRTRYDVYTNEQVRRCCTALIAR